VAQSLGFALTNLSLGLGAVSFTHTVKAGAPAVSAALSWLVLGRGTPPRVLAALVPVVGGVALAASGELAFSAAGFICAAGSNVCFSMRAILGKGAQGDGKECVRSIPLKKKKKMY
jgi:solute carrier family 35 protein E1